MKPTVLLLVGPTAVGKSKVAIELARKLRGEIISADSMLVYKELNIGTAKPSRAERKKVPHHLIDLVNVSKSFSVYAFRQKAMKAIRDILKRKKVPIVTGGSGLYVRALLEGIAKQPGANLRLRKKLETEARENGLAFLYEKLKAIDPHRAAEIKPQDERRIVRALEIFEVSGVRPSEWRPQKKSMRDLGFNPVVIGLNKDRSELYADIEKRVEKMFDDGLLKEATRLSKKKISKTAAQAVGYKEIWDALKNSPHSLEDLKNLIKKNTRHLAKRQITWFKKESGIEWFFWGKGETVQAFASRILREACLSLCN